MKRLILALALLTTGCASAPIQPQTVSQDAKIVLQALNTASQLSVDGLNLAKSIPDLPAATLASISDGVRLFNCALLDDGNPAPMPTGGTVTDSCHSHHAPMLGIISRLGQAASADTVKALQALGLAIADSAIQTLIQSGNASLAKAGQVAASALAVLR